MATTPDPFASPALGRMGVSAMPDPYAPWTPTSGVGLGGLSPSLADMAVQAERIVRGTQFTLPEIAAPTGPTRLYNPTTKEVFVNGFKFDADDEAAALQSEQYLGGPPAKAPAGDWVPLDDTAYRQYLQGIRDPSVARQFSRSFGRGVDFMQMLAGRGLQLAGAEQLGGRIVAQQMEDLRRTQPYAREFTDVQDIGDLGMWLVSVFGELGPNIVESIAAAGVGALAGTAASGNPLGGAAAGLASVIGKQTWKESVKAALKRRATGQAALPNDAKLIRTAAAIGGATAATLASGYATGAADIYGEMREQGAGPGDMGARAAALLGAVPYAALDVVPEALLVKRLLGQAGARPTLSSLATRKAKGAELLKRGAVGAAVGAPLEGFAEAGQEALLLGLSDQELGSADGIKRLLNAFAAGAAAGGVLGAGANILNPSNLLEPSKGAEPSGALVPYTPTPPAVIPPPPPPPPGTAVAPFFTPVTPVPPPAQAPSPAGVLPGAPLLLEGPQPPVSPVGEPVMMVTPQGQAYPDQMLQQRANVPPGAPGTQGVLDVFGGSLSAQELGTRMQPSVPPAEVPTTPETGLTPEEVAAQGVLQFAPEAPEGRPAGTMANRLLEIQEQLRREREFSAIQEQLLAQREAELEALAQQSRNARDLFEMEQPQPLPMVPATPRQPRQLPLFPPGSLPGPTRRQRAAAAAPLATIPPGATRLRRKRAQAPQEQLPLPYIATNVTPEIARATWNDRRPPTVRKWEALSEEAQQKWTEAIIAAKATPALRAQISREETQARLNKPKEKPSAVQEQGATTVPAQPGTAVGEGVGTEVPGEAPPTGKGTKLKRGKKAKPPTTVEDTVRSVVGKAAVGLQNLPQKGDVLTFNAGIVKANPVRGRETVVVDRVEEYRGSWAVYGTVFRDGEDVTKGVMEEVRHLDPNGEVYKVEYRNTGLDRFFLSNFKETQKLANELTPLGGSPPPKPRKPLKKEPPPPKPEEAAAPPPPTPAPAPAPAPTAIDDPALAETPAEVWAEMDTGVEWTALSPQQQTQWADSDRSQNTADTIAEDVRNPQTPETLWEDLKPVGAPTFGKLPPSMRTQWIQDVTKRKATMARAEELVEDLPAEGKRGVRTEQLPVAEQVDEAIREIEEMVVDRDARDVLPVLIKHAYFDKDSNNAEANKKARDFLNSRVFSEEMQRIMDDVFMAAASLETKLVASYRKDGKGTSKGTARPWFAYARSRNLLPQIKAEITHYPSDYQPAVADAPVVKTTEDKTEHTPQAILADLIDGLITTSRIVRKLGQKIRLLGERVAEANLRDAASRLYAQLDEQGRRYLLRGYPLSDYFTPEGMPKLVKVDDRWIITTQQLTREELQQRERERKLAEKSAAEERIAEARRAGREAKQYNDYDEPGGTFYRDDGTPLTSTVPPGRVRLLVNAFLAKLRRKPTTHIYANVEDLRQRNPELYRRAAASRPQGDFDTTKSAGFSFGPNVIIFTDFIRTEQHLRFVLAHETLGHFGFRAVVPDRELDAVLNRIYDASPDVQAAVEAKVANEGMSKLEAVEEFLSDNAADLDTSLIARLWNVVKNFLNKLGFEFQDDEARYLINQARRYVRRGEGGHAVSAAGIADEMQRLDADRSTGRFARYAAGDLASKAHATNAFNKVYSATGGLMGSVEAFYKNVFGKRRDVPGAIARLLEHVQTLDNKARRSYGLNKLYRLLENQQSFARALLSKYQRMTAFTHSPDVGFFGKGVAEADKAKAGELLAHAALLRAEQATDEAIRSYDSLVTVDATGNVQLNQTVLNVIAKAGMVSAEEFRRGFDVTYADGGKVRFQYDVDENSPEWKVYVEMRDAVNEAAVDVMLANYQSAQAETKRVISGLNDDRRGVYRFTQEDLAALRDVARQYQNIRYKGSDVASASVEIKKAADKQSEEFLIAFGRALFNDDVYKVWMKDPTAKPEVLKDLAEFQKAEYDDLRAQLQSLRAKFSGSEDSRREQSFVVQKAIRDLFLFDLQSKNADYYAKRTILGGYVPFTRRGTEQVRLVALDAKGNPAALDENIRATLPYFQFEDRSEALDVAEKLDQEFGGDNEWTLKDGAGSDIKVRFKVEVSRVRQSPDLTEAVNFNEFVYVLNRLNINLAPQARERIVTTLTRQNDRARKNLMRSGTPGWDKDVVRSVSEFLETSAHVAAKKLYRHRVDDVLLNNDNWLGDDERLKTLKDAVDSAATDGERARARREYEEYAFMYRYMKATGKGNTVEINGKELPTLGRGEDYREEAKQVLRWYSEATNITDSTEDMLSGETGSRLKLLTVLMQLGGSVATSVINLASIVTHSLPYLSYYNPKRGFGGGYGEVKAATALWKAASALKNPKLADDAFLNELVDNGGFERFGLTEDEARFLRNQSEQGTLQAAQFNALVGTARGKVFNNKAQAAIQLWMSMFSYTEQVNRRVTALAAYRLEKERAQAQGVTNTEDLIAQATEAGRRAVTTAQGEYAMFNRPEMARGNVLQYIFMYKQFVIITVQLMRSLPVSGQLMMLGILLLVSGVRGLPFAEDIFDIVDTIAQKLGLKMASVEKALAEWVYAVAPGMTPYVMRGVLDRITGATMSTRLGMGDMLPLTGAFRAGADPAREAADFAGPVFGGISGLIGMAASIAKYGAEVTGLRDDTTSFNSILRDSPVAFMRSVGDSYAYLTSGAITNARGQLVASDASYYTALTRLLGFYPAIASEQNDIVRLSKHVADYTKAIKAEYVSAYVKAKLAGDSETMGQIVNDVRQWNIDAEGTGLAIRDFVRSANRAALEASRPTVTRYMKAAPREVRPETLEMLRIMGLEEDVR